MLPANQETTAPAQTTSKRRSRSARSRVRQPNSSTTPRDNPVIPIQQNRNTGSTSEATPSTSIEPLMKNFIPPPTDKPNGRTEVDKSWYRRYLLQQFQDIPRPGSSMTKLQDLTTYLKRYIDILNIYDAEFIRSPEIMNVVREKLEPYVLASWCDYAEEHAAREVPVILTMLEFLQHKVDIGLRFWYPYTREAANL